MAKKKAKAKPKAKAAAKPAAKAAAASTATALPADSTALPPGVAAGGGGGGGRGTAGGGGGRRVRDGRRGRRQQRHVGRCGEHEREHDGAGQRDLGRAGGRRPDGLELVLLVGDGQRGHVRRVGGRVGCGHGQWAGGGERV